MAEAYALRTFLRDIAGIVVEEREPARIVMLITPFLQRFAAQGSGLLDSVLQAPPDQRGAYLLHEEGDDSFFVIVTLLPPAASTGVHFHGDWRASVVLRGEQEQTTYRRADEGSDLSCAELVEAGRERQASGAISLLPDGGYHGARSVDGPTLLLSVLAGSPDEHAYYRYDAEAKALRREGFGFLKAAH